MSDLDIATIVGHGNDCPRLKSMNWGEPIDGDCSCGLGSLAERVHLISTAQSLVDGELAMAVELACGDLAGEGESWTTDYYDNSIEVYGVREIDLDAAAKSLKTTCGFDRVWLHQHEAPRGNCRCPCR